MTALALGTANWGTSYGAPGRLATVDQETAAALARMFTARGHDLVDTAPAYGDAETMVGRVFDAPVRVVSKVELPADERDMQRCLDSVDLSRMRAGVRRLAGVLLHDPAAALTAPDLARLLLDEIRARGLAARVGVSVYAPAEALAAAELLGADLVQVPCNLLDQRFVQSGCLTRLATLGVEVHLRSAFLNGLLLTTPESLTDGLQSLRAPLGRLHAAAREHRVTMLQLSLSFCSQLPGAAAVVVGAAQPDQLSEVLDAWQQAMQGGPPVDWSALAWAGEALDPRTWPR